MDVFVSLQTSAKKAKVKLYQTLVQLILLYNAETWTLKKDHKRKLQVFEMSVLRRILRMTRRDRRRNIDIKKELGINRDVLILLQQKRLTCFGQVVRMEPENLPNILLYGHISSTRPRGRPRKRWIDNVRENCHLGYLW